MPCSGEFCRREFQLFSSNVKFSPSAKAAFLDAKVSHFMRFVWVSNLLYSATCGDYVCPQPMLVVPLMHCWFDETNPTRQTLHYGEPLNDCFQRYLSEQTLHSYSAAEVVAVVWKCISCHNHDASTILGDVLLLPNGVMVYINDQKRNLKQLWSGWWPLDDSFGRAAMIVCTPLLCSSLAKQK